jgi:hypothetical protein
MGVESTTFEGDFADFSGAIFRNTNLKTILTGANFEVRPSQLQSEPTSLVEANFRKGNHRNCCLWHRCWDLQTPIDETIQTGDRETYELYSISSNRARSR